MIQRSENDKSHRRTNRLDIMDPYFVCARETTYTTYVKYTAQLMIPCCTHPLSVKVILDASTRLVQQTTGL
eukprot:scaffold197021_cov68-Attheya_sp.AAC.4